jgi:2-polyprenyl-3-methyl-5-hydroxy-6-metoxy-1,4-benzoquinol methylase
MSAGRACRLCASGLSASFADLGMTPPSNAFLKAGELHQMERFYPLHAWVCGKCFLVQLEKFESPEEIFGDEYAYFSSYSDAWLKHSRDYVEMMVKRFGVDRAHFVMELASNDGYLLQYFVERGVPVLGIEPAANVAAVAERKGVPSLVKFFGTATARELAAAGKRPTLLIGNNVLAHVPDLNDFVEGMRLVLAPAGIITMEFPHLLRLIEENQFDTIYHEHFSYFSFFVAEAVFAAHGLTVFDVEEVPTHGGSLRIFARHAGHATLRLTERVAELKGREERAGLRRLSTYASFAEQVKKTKRSLLRFLIDAHDAGKRVVGYGAPAKGNTLLNYCGVRTDLLEYTVDRSPHKQGLFLPGTHIPIHAPEKIDETRPDYVLVLPWNLKDEIAATLSGVRQWGGRLVVPIPSTRVLD